MKYVIGIDLGATNIRVGLLDENLTIIDVVRERTSHDGEDALLSQIQRLIDHVSHADQPFLSITIGVPGRVRMDGYIFELPNIHVRDLDLVTPLSERYHVPIYVLNDAVAAGLAEANTGSGKAYQNVFFVTISSGVGGAFFRDGRYAPSSTEIGHTLFPYHDHFYEFEKLASGYGILNLARLNNLELSQGAELFSGYQAGDPQLSALYHDWLMLFQSFFHFIQTTFAPDVIVLTGGVMKSAAVFLDDFKRLNPECCFQFASHDQDAGLIGAACHGLLQTKLD